MAARELTFLIDYLSKTKYNEDTIKAQFRHKVLESDEWYNGQIRVRVHQSQHVINEANQD